jgi:hypothetical protein
MEFGYKYFQKAGRAREVVLDLLEDVFMTNKEQKQILDKVCKAIKQKKLIKFFYESKKTKRKDWRTIEPYLVGMYKSNKSFFVSGWFLPSKEQIIERQEKNTKITLSAI